MLTFLNVPINFEKLLEEICLAYNISLNHNQYVLVGNTVKSYLGYLKDKDQAVIIFDKGRMLWEKKR